MGSDALRDEGKTLAGNESQHEAERRRGELLGAQATNYEYRDGLKGVLKDVGEDNCILGKKVAEMMKVGSKHAPGIESRTSEKNNVTRDGPSAIAESNSSPTSTSSETVDAVSVAPSLVVLYALRRAASARSGWRDSNISNAFFPFDLVRFVASFHLLGE